MAHCEPSLFSDSTDTRLQSLAADGHGHHLARHADGRIFNVGVTAQFPFFRLAGSGQRNVQGGGSGHEAA